MSDSTTLTLLPGLTALSLVLGLGIARTYRARSVLLGAVACVCAALSLVHGVTWVRVGYVVLAVTAAAAAGALWSRPGGRRRTATPRGT